MSSKHQLLLSKKCDDIDEMFQDLSVLPDLVVVDCSIIMALLIKLKINPSVPKSF